MPPENTEVSVVPEAVVEPFKNQRVIIPLSLLDINDLQEGEELEFTFLVAPKEGDTEEDKRFVDLVMRRETEEDLKNINL